MDLFAYDHVRRANEDYDVHIQIRQVLNGMIERIETRDYENRSKWIRRLESELSTEKELRYRIENRRLQEEEINRSIALELTEKMKTIFRTCRQYGLGLETRSNERERIDRKTNRLDRRIQRLKRVIRRLRLHMGVAFDRFKCSHDDVLYCVGMFDEELQGMSEKELVRLRAIGTSCTKGYLSKDDVFRLAMTSMSTYLTTPRTLEKENPSNESAEIYVRRDGVPSWSGSGARIFLPPTPSRYRTDTTPSSTINAILSPIIADESPMTYERSVSSPAVIAPITPSKRSVVAGAVSSSPFPSSNPTATPSASESPMLIGMAPSPSPSSSSSVANSRFSWRRSVSRSKLAKLLTSEGKQERLVHRLRKQISRLEEIIRRDAHERDELKERAASVEKMKRHFLETKNQLEDDVRSAAARVGDLLSQAASDREVIAFLDKKSRDLDEENKRLRAINAKLRSEAKVRDARLNRLESKDALRSLLDTGGNDPFDE